MMKIIISTAIVIFCSQQPMLANLGAAYENADGIPPVTDGVEYFPPTEVPQESDSNQKSQSSATNNGAHQANTSKRHIVTPVIKTYGGHAKRGPGHITKSAGVSK